MRIVLLLALPLAACATTAPPADPTLAGSCRAEPAQSYVGQQASQDVGARLMAASGARILRWVPFGAMITMEFSADRLTVRLDRSNRIVGISCG